MTFNAGFASHTTALTTCHAYGCNEIVEWHGKTPMCLLHLREAIARDDLIARVSYEVRCAWCTKVLRHTSVPNSSGICAECQAKWEERADDMPETRPGKAGVVLCD